MRPRLSSAFPPLLLSLLLLVVLLLLLLLLPAPGAASELRGEAAASAAAEDERGWWRLAWDHAANWCSWHDDVLSNPFKLFLSWLGLLVSRPLANACHLLAHSLGVVGAFNALAPALTQHNISTLYAYYAGYTAEL
jgi:hypothetical protein